ncbi:alpha/beta hydrolase [Leptospira sp. 96542]|nr:alpha/beta hydrolase [Leptospira sp. 96542]
MKHFLSLFLIFAMAPIWSQNLKFQSDGGQISYLKMGSGSKNFILLPGIGDLKENYLPLAKDLEKEGTVYLMDLRGLGGSDVSFSSYGPNETAADTIGFIQTNGLENVYIIANSMSAASAIIVKKKLPYQIKGLALSGPFVRDKELPSFGVKLAIQIGFRGFWGASAWTSYYESLYPKNKPQDLEIHLQNIKSNLQEEGRLIALRSMLFAPKKESEEAIAAIQGGVVVVMGALDPDFESPEEEAKWIAEKTKGSYFLFETSGHYPYREEPGRFLKAIEFLWQKK